MMITPHLSLRTAQALLEMGAATMPDIRYDLRSLTVMGSTNPILILTTTVTVTVTTTVMMKCIRTVVAVAIMEVTALAVAIATGRPHLPYQVEQETFVRQVVQLLLAMVAVVAAMTPKPIQCMVREQIR